MQEWKKAKANGWVNPGRNVKERSEISESASVRYYSKEWDGLSSVKRKSKKREEKEDRIVGVGCDGSCGELKREGGRERFGRVRGDSCKSG